MARVCVLFAEGFEEIEAITVVDVLRRAGVEVRMLGVTGFDITGAHGITVRADAALSDEADDSWDAVILPGGMPGATNLRDDERVQRLVRSQYDAGRRVAAICAAPIALSSAGVLEGKRATSYPGFGEQLVCGEYLEERVVTDGIVTTSRGPGTALEFALTLAGELRSPSVAQELRKGMLV